MEKHPLPAGRPSAQISVEEFIDSLDYREIEEKISSILKSDVKLKVTQVGNNKIELQSGELIHKFSPMECVFKSIYLKSSKWSGRVDEFHIYENQPHALSLVIYLHFVDYAGKESMTEFLSAWMDEGKDHWSLKYRGIEHKMNY